MGDTRAEEFKKRNEDRYAWLVDIRDEQMNRPTAWKKFSPFETQFWQIKSKHWDTIVFFKKGKFFEVYEKDADIAHQEFDWKLTDRVNMKMCGVPESSFELWEDVVGENDSPSFGVTCVDSSTAEFRICAFQDDVDRTKLETILLQIKPKELVLEKARLEMVDDLRTYMTPRSSTLGRLLSSGFPNDLRERLEYLSSSFDESEAVATGYDEVFDQANGDFAKIESELEEYRKTQMKALGVRSLSYKDIGKDLYQLEVPAKVSVPKSWKLMSKTQSVSRYYTSELEDLVRRYLEAREIREEALRNILSEATSRSMVILDELGRGTSTFDGFAIAFSVLHYLSTHLVSRNYLNFSSDETNRRVTFLYKLVNGVCPRSFGMNVATMAGVPVEIVDRAESVAANFERQLQKSLAQDESANVVRMSRHADFATLWNSSTSETVVDAIL
ncbi:DNA mismatch repair protein msh6, partial [Cladochytrium tenue]